MKKLLILIIVMYSFNVNAQSDVQPKTNNKMQVAVWDTYVTKKDGTVMHFDILAPSEVKDTTVIFNFGRQYLKTKNQEGQPLSAKECRFCHIEKVQPSWETEINKNGFYIIEMENCK